ncbi:MAG: hypothetical protein ABIN36_05185 [Ferruginibacter sp.]
MNYFLIIAGTIGYLLALLMCWQESKNRKINFILAICVCIIITPLFGYLFISSFPKRNARGCKWCGNSRNEAEYCGLCHKNEAGASRPSKMQIDSTI